LVYIILNIKIEPNPFWINTCHNLMIHLISERSNFACIYTYSFFQFCKSYDSLTLTRSFRVFTIFSKFLSLSLIEITGKYFALIPVWRTRPIWVVSCWPPRFFRSLHFSSLQTFRLTEKTWSESHQLSDLFYVVKN
jgi:hypothetical protein